MTYRTLGTRHNDRGTVVHTRTIMVHEGFHPSGYDPAGCKACAIHTERRTKKEQSK